jgi:hypothetical protein
MYPLETTSVLKKWLLDHLENPYLQYLDKVNLSRETGLSRNQVQNWFINVRKVSIPHFHR